MPAEGSGCHDLGTRLPVSSGWGPRMPLTTPPRTGRHPQRKNYSARNVSSVQVEKRPPKLLAFKREKKNRREKHPRSRDISGEDQLYSDPEKCVFVLRPQGDALPFPSTRPQTTKADIISLGKRCGGKNGDFYSIPM